MKNIFVFSHRRSGTHLVLDLVRNNLLKKPKFLTLEDSSYEKINRKNNLLLCKSHATFPIEQYHSEGSRIPKQCNNDLLSDIRNAVPIYVRREVKDALLSLWFYEKEFSSLARQQTVSEFIKSESPYEKHLKMNRVKYWKHHIDGWDKCPNKVVVTYEDALLNPQGVLAGISRALDCQFRDRIIGPGDWRWKSSAVLKRRGIIGEYKDYFTADDIQYIEQELSRA